MGIFDIIIVQPIFNLLLLIFNFVGDFGVAIIILTIVVRSALYPLVKKQIHQTKVMREIQPELKRIQRQTKGNKAMESQLTMNLYKEKGIKPMSSLLTLIIQLPVFIAVFSVIRGWDNYLANYTYGFLENFMNIPSIIEAHARPYLFGVIDLSQWPIGDDGIQWALVILALIAAGLQFWQTKQTQSAGKTGEKKKFRDLFKEAAEGKELDQAEINEISAQMTSTMMYFFPVMTFMITINLPGAVVLYYAIQSAVAITQQRYLLNKDEKELKEIANEPSRTTAKRVMNAEPAEIVKKNSKRQGGTTVVRRVKVGKKGKK